MTRLLKRFWEFSNSPKWSNATWTRYKCVSYMNFESLRGLVTVLLSLFCRFTTCVWLVWGVKSLKKFLWASIFSLKARIVIFGESIYMRFYIICNMIRIFPVVLTINTREDISLSFFHHFKHILLNDAFPSFHGSMTWLKSFLRVWQQSKMYKCHWVRYTFPSYVSLLVVNESQSLVYWNSVYLTIVCLSLS